ncbi:MULTISPECIES: alanine racemase [unclassified Halomonas]|uniref:alanine racemase n=1 Tax=Halomonas sp. 707D7 TaxID=1681044 RepID=UPI00209EBC22|nr:MULTISPECIES: alanine racemase [unclassified Halomonas]MCP1315151.1 alanine racemase [Halomonas sp. 707D7]
MKVSNALTAVNADLIGTADARRELVTPALLIDEDALNANLSRMQALCRQAGIALRPHAKAHKCPEIARRQLAAGAVGICVATLGEAECFASAGIDDILCTSTFATEGAFRRAVRLKAQGVKLACVVDHPAVASRLGALAQASQVTLDVLIDVDMGRHRAGVASPRQAAALTTTIEATPGLRLAGLQGYAGHLSHCWEARERQRQAALAAATLGAVKRAVEQASGQAIEWVTGGSTGALLQEIDGPYTELQCGSYALMDTEYDAVDPDGTGTPLFVPSLFMATAVISANHAGSVTTDGGDKRLASKYAMAPRIVRGAPAGSEYRATSDEHGQITLATGQTLALGSLVEVQVPHCDPTINLYDQLHVVKGETLTAIWPIQARGR